MKKIRIVAHNATFHTDDVFAVAILSLALEKESEIEIVRTRDPEIIAAADYVVDVGGVYDGERRFDHHQEGGAGKREGGLTAGIPYAACGLVWKTFGERVAGSIDIAQRIDEYLISPLDASDNGIDTYTTSIKGLSPFMIQSYISSFNPTWKEHDAHADAAFVDMVAFAKKVLVRQIVVTQDMIEGEARVIAAYEASADKKIIVLEDNYPWDHVLTRFPEPLYAVYPNAAKDMWRAKTVRIQNDSYESRKPLPALWAGKTADELPGITGVPDAVFCHNKRFTCAARSKEGAIALAKLALQS